MRGADAPGFHTDGFVVRRVAGLVDAHNVAGLQAGDERLQQCENALSKKEFFYSRVSKLV